MDCSPTGSSVHGISQARKPEWVAISFFRGSFQPRDQTQVSCIGRWILYEVPREALRCECGVFNTFILLLFFCQSSHLMAPGVEERSIMSLSFVLLLFSYFDRQSNHIILTNHLDCA